MRRRSTIEPGEAESAAAFLPARRTLASLAEAARSCRGCPLYRDATQTVFGEGPDDARLVLVGEQPGDAEDREGRPFVGPAGTILARALDAAHIVRSDVYVTNAVKHFKYTMRGKKRLHQRPLAGEIERCRPWLAEELARIRPDVVVCLGATAARAIFGPGWKLTERRGTLVHAERDDVLALGTWHPSSMLRAPVKEERERIFEEIVADLAVARTKLSARAKK